MSTLYKIVAVVLIIVGSLAAGYSYGHHTSYANGFAAGKSAGWQPGYNKGHADGLTETAPRISDDETKLANVTSQYDQLTAAVKAYVAGQVTQSQLLRCTSNAVGTYTYTNCY